MGAKDHILIVVWTLREDTVHLIFGKQINPNGDVINNNSDPLFDRYADMDFSDVGNPL
jgi:hypothetical protein